MNLWSCLYLGVGLVATGEIWEFLSFVTRHPSIIWQLASVSAASALGQYFIFMCVSEFGPLPCSLVTTTRKFFTVLGSVIIFGNALSSRQWMGAALVFTGKVSFQKKQMYWILARTALLLQCYTLASAKTVACFTNIKLLREFLCAALKR